MLESAKDFEIPGAATNAVFELDLGPSKLPEGPHQIHLFGRLTGQYRKLTDGEAKALEAERDKGGESGKQAAEKLKTREATAMIWSAPINIQVKPEAKVAAK